MTATKTSSEKTAAPLHILKRLERDYACAHANALDLLLSRLRSRKHLRSSREVLHAYLARPGKRLRPLLFLGVYNLFAEHANDAPLPADILRVATGLEFFHAFSLAHDDVIDDSSSRRGRPSLHCMLEASERLDPLRAKHLAVVLGDIVFGFAMECLTAAADRPGSQEVVQRFLTIVQDTGVGESIELLHQAQPLSELSAEAILETYRLKTGRYTFEAPLAFGAQLGGAGSDVVTGLREASRPLGWAFQVANDLHEWSLPTENRELLRHDLRTGVKTYPLRLLRDALPPGQRSLLDGGASSSPDPEAIITWFHQYGIDRMLRERVDNWFSESRRLLAALPVDRAMRDGLGSLLDFAYQRRHHSEAGEAPADADA